METEVKQSQSWSSKNCNRLLPILNILHRKDLSIAELARRCNVTRQTLTMRFAIDDCRLSDMEKMAEALGYEFTWSFKMKRAKPEKITE